MREHSWVGTHFLGSVARIVRALDLVLLDLLDQIHTALNVPKR
jgi:hypothetical protein